MKKSIQVLIISFALISIGLHTVTGQSKRKHKFKSNKELVLTALTAVFINNDTSAVDKYWTKNYIQHNPMFPNGSDVIKNFAKNQPKGFKFEPGLLLEEDDLVIVHSRYSGFTPKPMIIVDIFRIKDGKIAEHWDVAQEEVTADKTVSGNPMFPINK